MKDWTLIQIEGEEPVPATPTEQADDKGKKAKAPPPKQDKKPAAGALEEITDNRPREMQFVKNYAEEGAAPIKILEEVARHFENYILKLQVFNVDRETQEEKELESQDIDMSQLLFEQKKDQTITWVFDKWKTMEIHYLKFSINLDQPLLNNFLRRKLNPLMVTLVSCKKIPFKTEPRYKPIYCNF